MTYLSVSEPAWVAWTAIGTIALALATVLAVWVNIRQQDKERTRDDDRRAADRERDDTKRAADRAHDAARRAEDRERDDLLRREAADQRDLRESAERRAREDYEARQVLVTIEGKSHPTLAEFTHYITVITPHGYPIKQVSCALVGWRGSGMGSRSTGHAGDEPRIDEHRIYYGFWTHTPGVDEYPIARWVDWHGNRYYQYRHYTDRFGQNTEWTLAAQKIDEWIRTGPKPDDESRAH